MVVFFVICTLYSAYLFQIADWGYGFTIMLIFFYILGYFIIAEGIRQNTMIEKVFRSYHAFSLPDVGFKKKDLLPNTAGFAMEWMGYSKQTVEKAMEYIKGEIKDNKINDVFDIPSAIATYFNALVNSKDPKNFEKVVFTRERLERIYNRIYKGIDDRSKLRKMYDDFVIVVDRNFKSFSLFSLQQPNFANEEVELREHAMYTKGKNKEPEHKILAMFTGVPGNLAYKFGWVNSLEEYMILANLEFARRNPGHYLSKKIRKKYKFTDQEIQDFAEGAELPKGLRFDL